MSPLVVDCRNRFETPRGARPVATVQSRSIDNTAAFQLNLRAECIGLLGGQICTMAGMVTGLNLQAVRPGTYRALSASDSGAGFADMHLNLDHSGLVYDVDAAAPSLWR